MKTKAAITIVALVLAANGVWAADDKATEEEDSLLTLVLNRETFPYVGAGGYTVVAPETTFRRWNEYAVSDPEKLKLLKKAIAELFPTNDVAATELVERFFERNKKPVRLTIKSSPKDGYLIDFDGRYKRYFAKDGGGWDRWYSEDPKAHGYAEVSLPVYDQKTGLVLVYKGAYYGERAGNGNIILYKYQKGKLYFLKWRWMWIC